MDSIKKFFAQKDVLYHSLGDYVHIDHVKKLETALQIAITAMEKSQYIYKFKNINTEYIDEALEEIEKIAGDE
jgi:geranylgeranyl pyrophosphate synthase